MSKAKQVTVDEAAHPTQPVDLDEVEIGNSAMVEPVVVVGTDQLGITGPVPSVSPC